MFQFLAAFEELKNFTPKGKTFSAETEPHSEFHSSICHQCALVVSDIHSRHNILQNSPSVEKTVVLNLILVRCAAFWGIL